MCVSFNSYGTDELVEQLDHLEDIAGDAEGERDPTFHLLRLEYRLSRDAWEKRRAQKPYRDEEVTNKKQALFDLRTRASGHRRRLGLVEGGEAEEEEEEEEEEEAKKKCEAEDSVLTSLAIARRLPVTRDNKDAILGTYNNLLARCGSVGDWRGATKTFEALVSRGFVPNRFAFNCIITSMKNAKPKAQVDRCISILDLMKSFNVPPTTQTYNAVISCCIKGRRWRRAVVVYELMKSENVKLDTSTMTMVSKIGTAAGREDAQEVYDALK